MKVLIVDDNKNDRRILSKLLFSNKYEVSDAENGSAALKMIEQSKPDLIISDIMMPVMDGFTFLREIMKNPKTKDIPFVFYTASYTRDKDKELAKALGALLFITKPVEPRDLLNEIETALHDISTGMEKSVPPLIESDENYFKEYTSRLFNKLEDKIIELEQEIKMRKHSEDELGKAAQQWYTTFNALKDAVCILDINGSVLRGNKAMTELTGKNYNKLIGKFCHEVVHGTTEPIDNCPFVRMKKTHQRESLVLPAGNRCYQIVVDPIEDESRELKGAVHVMTDITERKQAENLLLESENRYRTIFENAGIPTVIIDEDLTISMVNREFVKQSGFSREEVEGKKAWKEFVTKESPENGHYECGFIDRNGMIRDHIINITKIPGTQKSVASLLDITERKKADEIRIQKERAEYISKTKSEFLETMSHELRTPLNAIIGFSEILQQGIAGPLNEKQEHFLENIHKSGRFLLTLITDILDLSQIESGKIGLVIEKVAVPEAINEIIEILRTKARENNVVLVVDISSQLDHIDADSQRFKHILFNLLSNAIKFSKPDGGTVTLHGQINGDFAQFSISDTGIGIKEENMDKLFVLFKQLDSGTTRRYGGAGLGLAITKHLVELHGGKIWVESRYNEGSTFTFSLPLKPPKKIIAKELI